MSNTLIGAHAQSVMNNQWGYPGSGQPPQQGGGWGSPSMNAAHWQQQQQMSFQQQGGMQPQGFYQPTGGLPGNWGGMNPNQGFGQFQSAPERHSPLVQHTGFMNTAQQQFPQNQYPQHGGSQQGAPITHQQQQHLLHQQQQQQLMLQQQQAIQEQMIKSQQEEMRRIEYERKQLKLKSINVSRVTSSTGPSLESLIGFSVPPPSSSSPSSLTKHAVKNTPPPQHKPVPPQEQSVVTTAAVINVSEPVVTQQQIPSLAKQQPSVSLEGLMANSMNLLDERTTRPISKTDFPSSKTNRPPTSSPHHTAVAQKAPAWSVNTEELSGLFAQHTQPNQEDDSFGDFQSVPSTQPQPASSTVPQSTANTPASSHDAAGSNKQAFRQDELPLWLSYPAAIPSVYHTVYEKSWSGEGELTSTELLYPLLVSSGLERGTLRDLWTLVNRSVAGRLNKQELFLLLGLIGIVQSGKSTPSLSDLKDSFHPPSVTLSALQQHSDELISTASSSHAQNTPPLFSSSTASTDVFGTAQSAAAPIQTNQEEKYDVFNQLQETTAPASSTMKQENKGGDIYSVFRALEPTTSNTQLLDSGPTTGDTSHAPMSDFATFPPAPSSSASPQSSRHLPTVSDNNRNSQISTVPVTSGNTENGVFGSGFLADFSSQSVVGTGSQQTTSQPTDNWGDFTSFSGSEWSQPVASSATMHSSTTTTTTSLSVEATPIWPQSSSIITTTSSTMPFPLSDTISSTSTFPLFSTTSDSTKEPSPAGFIDDFSEFSGYSSPQETQLAPANGIERDSSVLSQVSSLSSSSQILEPQTKKLSQFEVWQKCLEKCAEVLKTTSAVLSGSDKSTLEEIAVAEESKKKLSGIGELYRFAKRVHVASHGPGKKSLTPSKSEQLVSLMVEVRKQWTAINSALPNNTMSKLLGAMSSGVLPPDDRDSPLCCLCLFPEHIFISPLVTMDSYSEQYSLAMTEHDEKKFHTQCANFWQFAIGEKLNAIQ